MLNPLPYPMVQGKRTQHSDVEVRLNGTTYKVKAIDWKSPLKPGTVKANSVEPIGWTTGEYEPTGSIELYKPEADLFESDLMADPSYVTPDGYHEGLKQIFFPVVVNYRQTSAVPFSQTVFNARITDSSDASTTGTEHHARKYELILQGLSTDGRYDFVGQSGSATYGV